MAVPLIILPGLPLTTLDYPQTWGGSFAFTGTNDLNLGAGAVTMSAARTVTTNGGNLTVGGVISGAFRLTKAGAGALTLIRNKFIYRRYNT